MRGTPVSREVSTRLLRIAQMAKDAPEMAFNNLGYHLDVKLLRVAYERTRKDGAVGVDGYNAEEYSLNLDENLQGLLDRVMSGTYKAPPVRRVYIPKADGKSLRPLGIPTFEDKVLQRAVAMLLEAIYEQDFLGCSYGFRPGRSAHQALQALWEQIGRQGSWVLEVDIRGFFDNLDHGKLREILDKRVRDKCLRRLIDKWLKAGVMEAGELKRSEQGTPQGGVISPILANIYLHEVVDTWFHKQVVPLFRQDGSMVRYADDFVIVFRNEHTARTVMGVLPKRFARFGLELHPDKTKLLNCRPPAALPEEEDGGTFDFLGFTHYWGKGWKVKWVLKRKTAKSRLKRALVAMNDWCRDHRHMLMRTQHKVLVSKLLGHYAYYGITNNYKALSQFHQATRRIWQKWLSRRSQRSCLSWERMLTILVRWPLPTPHIKNGWNPCVRSEALT